MMNAPHPTRATPGERAALVALMLFGTLLRAWEAYRTPLWFDELYILRVVERPLGAALRLVRDDIHPPLYYVLRWAWTAVGGDGLVWQKTLSVLIAAASLYAVYRLARLMFGTRAGLLALALVAVNGAHAHYAQEGENYALAWFLMLMMAGSAWAYVDSRRRRDLAGFAVWSLLALYDHYLAIAVFVVLVAWGAVRLRREPAALKAWGLAVLVVGVLFAPQKLVFLEQWRREGSAAFFTWPTHADYQRLWRAAAFGMSALTLPLLALAVLPLLRRAMRPAAVLLWLLIVIPVLEKRLWVVILPREGLLLVSLAAVLVAAGVAMLPGRWLRIALGAALVLVGLRAWRARSVQPEPFALASVARTLDAAIRPGDVVIHAETHSLLFFLHAAPHARQRLLVEAGARVPYFDAGLVVPDSCYLEPAGFDSIVASGARWWGVEVDRAFVTRGVASRAGAPAIARIESAPRDTAWTMAPARLVRGAP